MEGSFYTTAPPSWSVSFPPCSWRHIAPAQSIQNAPLRRMPSWPTSWTLRSLSLLFLHLPTIPPSTPAALKPTLKGATLRVYIFSCSYYLCGKRCSWHSLCDIPAVASPTMAPWRAPFLSTPPTAPLLMRLWWDKEPRARWAGVSWEPQRVCICLLWHFSPPPPRPPCLIHMALSCLAREERRPPSAEKVRDTTGNHPMWLCLRACSQIRNLLLF